MLFQPTNITPDVLYGDANGTVDVSDGLTVSWQINGNTPIIAYQLFFYQNNTSSTAVYNTPIYVLDEPVYGTDALGNPVLFTAETISAQTLSNNGITNGNQYKLKIRQYYAAQTYLDQRSMSVFYTRSDPSLSISAKDANGTAVTTTLGTISATMVGTYSQAQGDEIDWATWIIEAEYVEGEEERYVQILDSGRIYNASSLEISYDGFVNNQTYLTTLTICTEHGVEKTATYEFTTSWAESTIFGESNACLLNSQSTAVKVGWSGYKYIEGVPTGWYELYSGFLMLHRDSNVLWSTENGSPLSISAPWALRMKIQLATLDATVVKVQTTSGYIQLSYDMPSRYFKWQTNSSNGTISTTIAYDATVQIIITPTQIILYSTGYTSVSVTTGVTYTQGSITSVQTFGTQLIDYIQIINNYSQNDLAALSVNNIDYDPDVNTIDSTYFLADFSNKTLDAGTLKIAGTSISGWSVYRRKESEPISTHLIDVGVASHYIMDYGCGSGEGLYHYEIYPIGAKRFLTDAIISNSFNPCFSNWAVIEAERDEETDQYTVVNEYVFGKNLSSGSISNNNTPTVYKNFTRYATVLKARPNYQSGTLSSIIGHVGYIDYMVQDGDTIATIASRFHTTVEKIMQDNRLVDPSEEIKIGSVILVTFTEGMTSYFDDKKLRDAIWNLSTTTNHLFLKSRKGDVIEIAPSQDISMSYTDGTRQQPVTVSFPWVQIGDATHTTIVGRSTT